MWLTYRLDAPRDRARRSWIPLRDGRRVLGPAARAEPLAGGQAVLGSHDQLAARASRRSRSGTGASTTRRGSRPAPACSVSSGLLIVGAFAFALLPRNKTPLQLAALTGVLLLGFQLVLTHWSYLYIPWFFPFVAYATLAQRVRRSRRRCRPSKSDFRSPLRFISAAAALASIFVASWAALHQDRFKRGEIVDTPVYQSYGDAMCEGEVPYRDFAVEYPPGALPFFVLPAYEEAGNVDSFRRAFEALVAACGAVLLSRWRCRWRRCAPRRYERSARWRSLRSRRCCWARSSSRASISGPRRSWRWRRRRSCPGGSGSGTRCSAPGSRRRSGRACSFRWRSRTRGGRAGAGRGSSASVVRLRWSSRLSSRSSSSRPTASCTASRRRRPGRSRSRLSAPR